MRCRLLVMTIVLLLGMASPALAGDTPYVMSEEEKSAIIPAFAEAVFIPLMQWHEQALPGLSAQERIALDTLYERAYFLWANPYWNPAELEWQALGDALSECAAEDDLHSLLECRFRGINEGQGDGLRSADVEAIARGILDAMGLSGLSAMAISGGDASSLWNINVVSDSYPGRTDPGAEPFYDVKMGLYADGSIYQVARGTGAADTEWAEDYLAEVPLRNPERPLRAITEGERETAIRLALAYVGQYARTMPEDGAHTEVRETVTAVDGEPVASVWVYVHSLDRDASGYVPEYQGDPMLDLGEFVQVGLETGRLYRYESTIQQYLSARSVLDHSGPR